MSSYERDYDDIVKRLFQGADYEHDSDVMYRAAYEITDLREYLAEVVAALKPFAAMAVRHASMATHPEYLVDPVAFKDCARALEIVSKYEKAVIDQSGSASV